MVPKGRDVVGDLDVSYSSASRPGRRSDVEEDPQQDVSRID